MMLLVYVFALIKPIMPIINDVLAHTFFEKTHLATIHYENGKYHMHLELQDEVKKTDTKHVPVFSINDVLYAHVKTNKVLLQPFFYTISEINSPYINVSTDVNIPTPLLPPEC